MRVRIKQADALPRELARSAPRQVTLTSAGMGVAISIAALIVGAIIAGVLLSDRVSRDSDPTGVTTASIVNVQRRDERLVVTYSYSVGGREYAGRSRVRKFERQPSATIRYVVSRPGESWLEGYAPRPAPFWLPWAVPGLLLFCTVPLLFLIRRQAALLREGRAALARITNTQKRKLGDHSTWRVDYEWRLLSGARRSGRHDLAKMPPPVGTHIPIIYDRDNPKRQAPYPFSLVRVSR